MNINDWSAIQTLFDKLHKQADKARRALGGGAGAPHPRAYIKQLAELEVRHRDDARGWERMPLCAGVLRGRWVPPAAAR